MSLPPGTLLLGRFSLEDLVEFDDGIAVWRARDVTLRRSVAIRAVDQSDPRAPLLTEAARSAAPVVDPRILRVLDTATDQGVTFAVHEWVAGVSLEDLLQNGPLEPQHAATLMRDVADAIDHAHAVGAFHGALTPGKLLLTDTGEMRVIGFGIDAALHADPAAKADGMGEDVRRLGVLLFAALTGRSPHASESPRQVRAGVPRQLDDLCVQLLGGRSLSAGQMRDRLDTFLGQQGQGNLLREIIRDVGPTIPRRRAPLVGLEQPQQQPHWLRLAGLVAIGGLLLVAIAVAVRFNLPEAFDLPGDPASPTAEPSTWPISSISDFDPQSGGGSGEENPGDVGLATDGDLGTAWTTVTYFGDPRLGLLKDGVGLLVDLGEERSVSEVLVTLGSGPTDVSLLIAPGASTAPTAAGGFTLAASSEGVSETVRLRPDGSVTTRYFVIWLTRLPPVAGGYRGAVAEIEVRS
jgi:putative peptidoglycan lipid II flippase